jgi:hypothetical protein
MLVCASHTVVEDPELKELFETRVGKGLVAYGEPYPYSLSCW